MNALLRDLTEQDRAEVRQVMDEMRAWYDKAEHSPREAAAKFHEKLDDALQAHKPWASYLLEQALLDGLWKMCKRDLKAEAVHLVSHRGQSIGVALRYGVRKTLANGSIVWQQQLFRDMSWAEVEQMVNDIGRQINSVDATRTQGKRLLDLRPDYPDSFGPSEACERMGTTVEAYLTAEVA